MIGRWSTGWRLQAREICIPSRCAGSNFPPAEHVFLREACVKQGDFVRGRRVMSAMLPLTRALERCVKCGGGAA